MLHTVTARQWSNTHDIGCSKLNSWSAATFSMIPCTPAYVLLMQVYFSSQQVSTGSSGLLGQFVVGGGQQPPSAPQGLGQQVAALVSGPQHKVLGSRQHFGSEAGPYSLSLGQQAIGLPEESKICSSLGQQATGLPVASSICNSFGQQTSTLAPVSGRQPLSQQAFVGGEVRG